MFEHLEVERADLPAALVQDFDIAFALQTKQCFAHRRAAHLQALAHFVFAEAVAGQEMEIENVCLQPGIRL
ncbi:hypothetical protein D3C73_1414670 [compost metagenome]